jgi:hypothetical protein
MKKLNFKALLSTIGLMLGLLTIVWLGIHFPTPTFITLFILSFGYFSYSVYKLFSIMFDK